MQRGQCDAYAATDLHADVIDQHRLAEGLEQTIRQRRSALGRMPTPADERKFVAAQAGRQIACADPFLQTARHPLQDAVAGRMTKRIIDVLEVIEIEEHQRTRPGGVINRWSNDGQLGAEMVTVRESGQRIEIGQRRHFDYSAPAVGDV